MQRCPTCDFVYEEDQRVCDMDGAELVHDPHELPRNLPVVRPKRRARSITRMIAIVALPNVLLAGLLFYGTTQQVAQSSNGATEPVSGSRARSPQEPIQPTPSAPTEREAPEPVKEETPEAAQTAEQIAEPPGPTPVEPGGPVEQVGTPPTPAEEKAEPATVGVEPKSPSLSPRNQTATTGGRPSGSRPAVPTKKAVSPTPSPRKDSKVSALIKKTASVLKKPFQKW